jgi:7-hydroxymethyl chlorophyll a reductase
MSKCESLEEQVHGRGRREDEAYTGVAEEVLYARNAKPSWDITPQPDGYASAKGTPQWTGIVTQMAIQMLETGAVDAVVCVQSDPEDRFTPKPVVARTVEDIIASKGVKPSYSPNLSVLAHLEALPDVKKLLFIGVGCQVQAVRSIEKYLGLEELYIIGTNCADNGPRDGLQKFLDVASKSPDTVIGYEFMQDYCVHIKHLPGSPIENDYEIIPYFSLPSNYLAHGVIGEPCRSCFDYTNGLADIVVGYMGVPYFQTPMTKHPQYVTVRNARGRQMFDLIRDRLEVMPTVDSGNRKPFVLQTLEADDAAFFGKGPPTGPPPFVANLLPTILQWIGPKGLEFGRYSLDYHYLRNWLYCVRNMGREQAERHTPDFVKRIVASYNTNGELDRMLQPQENVHAFDVPGAVPHPPGWTGGLQYDEKTGAVIGGGK